MFRSDGSCIHRDTFWPAVHETSAVVLPRGFPKGQPASHAQSYAMMLMCLRHVEETLPSRDTNDRWLPHRTKSGHEQPFPPGPVGRSLETLPLRPKGAIICLSTQTTHWWSFISVTKKVCFCAHYRENSSLQAVYIPGHLKQRADALSTQGLIAGEWRLCPKVVEHPWRASARRWST